jgi:hypothetical protein
MAAVRRMSGASAAVVVWSLASCALALSPAGVGGVPRAVNSVVFLLMGPGIALATFLGRRYTIGSRRLLSPGLVAVISETFAVTLLVLTGMVLLLVGAWSVEAVVGVVTAVAVLVAVWPAGAVPVEVFAEPSQRELEAVAVTASAAVPVPVAARAAAPVVGAPVVGAPVVGAPSTAAPVAGTQSGSDQVVMWS